MDLLYVGRMVDILELFTMTSNRVSELITLALNIDIYLIYLSSATNITFRNIHTEILCEGWLRSNHLVSEAGRPRNQTGARAVMKHDTHARTPAPHTRREA